MSEIAVYGVLAFIGLYFVAGVLDSAKGQPRGTSGQYQTWRTNQLVDIILALIVGGIILWYFFL